MYTIFFHLLENKKLRHMIICVRKRKIHKENVPLWQYSKNSK